jgi:hypothetical protein
MFPGRADDFLRVLVRFGIVVLLHGVFVLRLDVTAADLNGVQFIGADSAEKYLVATSLGIERPLSADINDGEWERPIVVAD